MELTLSLFVFLFGVLTWIPFLNGVYGQDQVAQLYVVDRSKKGDYVFYKDSPVAAIGHYFHTILMLSFFNKYNSKAFYWIMCIYCSISTVILFWIISILFGLLSATIGSILFSIYIVSPRLDGNWAPFEQLLPLPLFGSILCILFFNDNNSTLYIFLGGILFGYSVLIKQIAVVYLPGFLIMVMSTGFMFSHLLTFLSGFFIANLIPALFYLFRHNAFLEYFISNWLFLIPSAINPKKYNKFYPKHMVRGEIDSQFIKQRISHNSLSLLPLIFLSIIGIIIVFKINFSFFIFGLFVCFFSSIITIFMRKTFFPHYWLNTVPWLVIFSCFGMSEIIKGSILSSPFSAVTLSSLLSVALLFSYAIYVDKNYYVLSKDPYQFLRKVWGEEMVKKYKIEKKIGEYIKETTNHNDKILLCNWAPHILFYSDRTNFTPETCLYTEDFLELYSKEKPSYYDYINTIFKFKIINNLKKRKNIFKEGYPEIIVFGNGTINIDGFEDLTGMNYSLDENLEGYPLFRADLELTELLALFRESNSDNIQKEYCTNLQELIGNNNSTEAFSLIKKYLKTDPSNESYLLLLADCLINIGKHKLLFNFIKKIIEKHLILYNCKLSLLNKVGESLFVQNKYDDAEKTFQNVLKLDSKNITALNNLGVILHNQNKKSEAINNFQKVLELDPNNKDAIANLSTIC